MDRRPHLSTHCDTVSHKVSNNTVTDLQSMVNGTKMMRKDTRKVKLWSPTITQAYRLPKKIPFKNLSNKIDQKKYTQDKQQKTKVSFTTLNIKHYYSVVWPCRGGSEKWEGPGINSNKLSPKV